MVIGERSLVLVTVALLTAACGGDDGGGGGGDVDGGSTSDLVGPAGGTVSIVGAELEIPAGALEQEVEITITETADAVPGGFLGSSPVFQFEPDGLVFAQPVAARLAFEGSGEMLDLIWSVDGGEGYEAMGATIDGQMMVGAITHFSQGFVGRRDPGSGDACADVSCAVGQVCVAGQCVSSGGDSDGDGVANGEDNCPDLANPGQGDHDRDGAGDACDASACSDGGDNDGDTHEDSADSGCFSWFDDSELVDCADGIDNDGDDLIDLPIYGVLPAGGDPGCTSGIDGSEWPECSDGFDNDGDGSIDLADSYCLSPEGSSEAPLPATDRQTDSGNGGN